VTSKLEQIIAAVVTELEVLIPGINSRIGAKHIQSAQDTLPRVVWVPSSVERFEANDAPGQMQPRAFASRIMLVEVHLWAKTYEGIDALINDVALALRRKAVGAHTITTGAWKSEDGGGQSHQSSAYALLVEIRVPLTERPKTLVSPVTPELTPVAQFPAGDVDNP
jgi:hypothetical protein